MTTSSGTALSWEDSVTWLVNQLDSENIVRECYFDRPVIEAVRRYSASEEWTELKKWLPENTGRALDVGAGNGIVSYALAKSGWQATALEPDPSQYVGAGAIREIAESEDLRIDVIEEWGESMPFPNDHFDLVMARQVIHHAYDLAQMYAEIARVTKPGGTIIAFRDHVVRNEKELNQFLARHPLHHLYGGENAFKLEEYRDAMENAGLRVRQQINAYDSPINYGPRALTEYRTEIIRRLPRVLRPLAAAALPGPLATQTLLKLAHRLSPRPGWLVSFICDKVRT